jgi:hypothetical protein
MKAMRKRNCAGGLKMRSLALRADGGSQREPGYLVPGPEFHKKFC